MTQAQLAEKLNVSIDHISHAESGCNGISVWLLLDICMVLNVTPNDILAGTYFKDDEAEQHGEKITSLMDSMSDDQFMLEYFYRIIENRKKER